MSTKELRRSSMLGWLQELKTAHDEAASGGGKRHVQRHLDSGKLLIRQRNELLLDPDTSFLELSTLAGWGTRFPVGGSVVTGIGRIEGIECVVVGEDPTVLCGATNPMSQRRVLRALDISHENRMPLVRLVESGGADFPNPKDIVIPGPPILHRNQDVS